MFSALECCVLICEDVLMHKLHNSSEVQHWGFPALSESQRQKKTDNVHQRWCHFKICYFQHSNITRMKHSSCLSQPPLSSVSLQPSVDPQKLHQRGWEGDVLQDVCPLAGIALSTHALPKGKAALTLPEWGWARRGHLSREHMGEDGQWSVTGVREANRHIELTYTPFETSFLEKKMDEKIINRFKTNIFKPK